MFGKRGRKCGGFVGLASLIGVTFLLIATVIGVTVVRNRGITLNPNKMAEDVYPSPTGGACSGSCYYGSSACSSLGLQNASGSCSGGICCGAPLINNCTNGDSYCVDSNTVAVCKVDKSGYTETDCASGSTCDSAQKKCVSSSAPTPTPTPASGACAGQCFWGISACSTVSRYSSTGTCSGNSICCGDVFSANNCTNGDSYCVDSNTVGVCKTDKSGYTNTDCASGSKCDFTLKKCVGSGGGGDCAATSQSCSNRACCNSSDVCAAMPGGSFCVAKGDCTSGDTKCVAEGLTSFVYRCGSNGYWQKERACDAGCEGGSCKKACNPGEKRCSGSELEVCNSTGTAWTGQSCTDGCQTVNGSASCKVGTTNYSAYTSYAYTPPAPSNEWQEGTAACMSDPNSDACKEWNKKQLTEAAIVGATLLLAPLAVPEIGAAAYAYGTAALTTLPASIQTAAAITGTVAGYAGVAAGTVACAVNPYSEGCIAYIAGIQGDPTALMQLAGSADDLIAAYAKSKNPLYGMTFNITNNQYKMSSFNSESQPVEITQLSPTKITIKNQNSQYISIDLKDPLLKKQVAEALDAVANLPPSEQYMGLYNYSSKYGYKGGDNYAAYDKLSAEAAKAGIPINLSEALNNKNAVCLEKHCFLNIADRALGSKDGVLDFFLSSDPKSAGHLTNSAIVRDPVEKLWKLNGLMGFDSSKIGLIQRINLFSNP